MEWYRHTDEVDYRPNGDTFVRLEASSVDIRDDGSVWVRREEDGVRLVLIRATPVPGRRLHTSTRNADGSEGRKVTRDQRRWAKLTPADLANKAEGLIMQPSESLGQVAYGWYLTPQKCEIEAEGALQPPDASRGKLAHLVLPFSFFENTLVSFKRDALTDFFTLGIGIETYFAQLVSLASVFLLMGFASLGNLFTNLSMFDEASDFDYDPTSYIFASSLGSRTTEFDVFQSANAELAGTIIFVAYLMWLRYFNVQRAKMSQEATTSAADYTVEVSSLEQLPSSFTEDDVAQLFARTVVDSWRFRRKQQYDASTLWRRRWSTLWRRWRSLPEEEEQPPKRQTRRGSTGRRGSVVPGVGGAALPGGGGAHDDPWWAELGQKAFKRDKLSERELACTRIAAADPDGGKVPPRTVVYAVEASWDKYEAVAAAAKAADAAFLEEAEAAARAQSVVQIDRKLATIGLGPQPPPSQSWVAKVPGGGKLRSAGRSVVSMLLLHGKPFPYAKQHNADSDSDDEQEASTRGSAYDAAAGASGGGGGGGKLQAPVGEHDLGKRCFVTFRYAADAQQAVWAFSQAAPAGPCTRLGRWLWGLLTCQCDRPRYVPPVPLKVRRAPEADDVMWENMSARAADNHLPARLRTYLLMVMMLLPAAWLVYELTESKLAVGHGQHDDGSLARRVGDARAEMSAEAAAAAYGGTAADQLASLNLERSVELREEEVGTGGLSADAQGTVVGQGVMWLLGRTGAILTSADAEAAAAFADDLHEEGEELKAQQAEAFLAKAGQRAETMITLAISTTITLINMVLQRVLARAAAVERPSLHSTHECRSTWSKGRLGGAMAGRHGLLRLHLKA